MKLSINIIYITIVLNLFNAFSASEESKHVVQRSDFDLKNLDSKKFQTAFFFNIFNQFINLRSEQKVKKIQELEALKQEVFAIEQYENNEEKSNHLVESNPLVPTKSFNANTKHLKLFYYFILQSHYNSAKILIHQPAMIQVKRIQQTAKLIMEWQKKFLPRLKKIKDNPSKFDSFMKEESIFLEKISQVNKLSNSQDYQNLINFWTEILKLDEKQMSQDTIKEINNHIKTLNLFKTKNFDERIALSLDQKDKLIIKRWLGDLQSKQTIEDADLQSDFDERANHLKLSPVFIVVGKKHQIKNRRHSW